MSKSFSLIAASPPPFLAMETLGAERTFADFAWIALGQSQ
jgi:hypothetical protein